MLHPDTLQMVRCKETPKTHVDALRDINTLRASLSGSAASRAESLHVCLDGQEVKMRGREGGREGDIVDWE
jgi:hypothetical protein